jgi:rhodanese-related sulfurtransferase
MNKTPEISVEQLAEKLKSPDGFILLDVREAWEVARAKIPDDRLVVQPMSELAQRGLDALHEPVRDKDAEIYVLCHGGVRSADVTNWLAAQGWTKVFSVAGGIEDYARRIDPGVGRY